MISIYLSLFALILINIKSYEVSFISIEINQRRVATYVAANLLNSSEFQNPKDFTGNLCYIKNKESIDKCLNYQLVNITKFLDSFIE